MSIARMTFYIILFMLACGYVQAGEMADEVNQIFTQYLNNNNTASKDKRWDRINQYSIYVEEAVERYQDPNNEIGIALPEGAHYIVAVIMMKETSLKYKVKGKSRGEVGLMQVHGEALNGHKKKEVRYNAKLGIDLGVRWLTYSGTRCMKTKHWSKKKWLAALSIYASGKRKYCKAPISVAKRRYRLAKRYEKYVKSLDSKPMYE